MIYAYTSKHFTLTHIIVVYHFFTLTQSQYKYLSNTFTQSCVNVLGVCKCIYYISLMIIPFCKSILISYGCMFWCFFFLVWQWAIWLAYHQKHYEIPLSPQVKITFFTLFYTYTILHDYVKLYKCICFTLTQFYTAV
jgi:hypothetical protein